MACVIGVAREQGTSRAALARSGPVQAVGQPAQLPSQPAVIFWGRLPLEALQFVVEFVQDRLQEFAQRLGLVRGPSSGSWARAVPRAWP
jgi:hypothetical protein